MEPIKLCESPDAYVKKCGLLIWPILFRDQRLVSQPSQLKVEAKKFTQQKICLPRIKTKRGMNLTIHSNFMQFLGR